jgi:hypothetical protein
VECKRAKEKVFADSVSILNLDDCNRGCFAASVADKRYNVYTIICCFRGHFLCMRICMESAKNI